MPSEPETAATMTCQSTSAERLALKTNRKKTRGFREMNSPETPSFLICFGRAKGMVVLARSTAAPAHRLTAPACRELPRESIGKRAQPTGSRSRRFRGLPVLQAIFED
jgi:hypothetical protein